MKYLEYLQIKRSIDQNVQQDKLNGLIIGLIFITVGLIIYITLNSIIISTTMLIMALVWFILLGIHNYVNKQRQNVLDQEYKDGTNAEDAAKKVFSIKEIKIVLTK